MFGYGYGLSTEWLLLVLVTSVIGFIAQNRVQSAFNKYSRMPTQAGRSGAEVANSLINQGGFQTAINGAQGAYSNDHTTIKATRGSLTDHFDPRNNTVALSEPVYGSSSISAVAVAAHECGHVMQHREGYGPVRARDALVPVVNLASNLAMPMMLLGIFIGITNLIWVGIALYAAGFLFQVVTLPVELNASARALDALEAGNYLSPAELPEAKKVLRAAAMTYVAAALASALQLLYLVGVAGGRRRD